MRVKIPQLAEAFTGHFDDHHRFLLAQMLARIDGIDADIAVLDAQIETPQPHPPARSPRLHSHSRTRSLNRPQHTLPGSAGSCRPLVTLHLRTRRTGIG